MKDRPTIIVANTIKGNGIKHMTNNPQWHGKAPPREHTPILLEELRSECFIAPSIIAGQQENYEEKIKNAERGGADIIHLDIMDGRFVPNTTFFADTIKQLRRITTLPFDAHLMIENPLDHIQDYVDARCDVVTVHAEMVNESQFLQIIDKLLSNGISPGIAFNPSTDIPSWLYSHLHDLDVILIMSVHPGFAGQKFIPGILSKIHEINQKVRKHGFRGYIEADGGIDATIVQKVYEAGARIFVAGNAVYGSGDIHGAIIQLRHKVNVALERKLLDESNAIGIRNDWLKTRKHILIPLANELGIEEELHALK